MQSTTFFPPNRPLADPLVLVQEINHRVVNEYSSAIAGIQLAAKYVTSSRARNALAGAAERLSNCAAAHRALQAPVWVQHAELADYLQTLCSALTAARLEEQGVRLTLAAEAVSLPAERCWRVGLIVSELITNCSRHGLSAGPGSIRVEIEVAGDAIVCRVMDDGQGAATIQPGQGVAVVLGLAEELGGTVVWRSNTYGTTAELTFPVFAAEQLS